MRIFKYRLFEKWAKSQGLTDDDLKKAVMEIENGLIDANLGGHVYKKRLAKPGQGKRAAYRTIVLMKRDDKLIFAHGFAKAEQDNLSKHELLGFKIMAEAFFDLNPEQINALLANKNFTEITS